MVPVIISDLAISPSKLGFAMTGMWICFAVMQYPAGRFADCLSSKTVLVVGGLVLAISSALLWAVSSYGVFVLSTAILGIGGGLFIVPMRVLLSDLFVEKRGQAFGLNTAAAMGGGTVAAGLAVLSLRYFTWQGAFLPVVVLTLLVVVAIHTFGEESYVVTQVHFDLRETLRRVFRTRRIRYIVFSYTLVILVWQGVFAFLPVFLQTDKAFSSSLATGSFALLFLVGMVVMPLAGRLSDRIGSRTRVALGSLLLCMFGLSILILAAERWILIVGLFLFSAGLLSYPPVMQAYLIDFFPNDNVGGDFGAFRSVYLAIASLGPAYVGVAVEYFGFTEAFTGLFLCLAVSAGILVQSTKVSS
jgi:MFS family permease